MSRVEQSLAGFISNSKTVLMGIDLSLWEKEKFNNIQRFFERKSSSGLQHVVREVFTLCSWWRSSRASAPATSLASSSALIRACISVTQLVRSLKSAVKRCSLMGQEDLCDYTLIQGTCICIFDLWSTLQQSDTSASILFLLFYR